MKKETKNTAKAEAAIKAAPKKTVKVKTTAKPAVKSAVSEEVKGVAPIVATTAVKTAIPAVESEEKEARRLEGEELKAAIESQTNGMSVIITRSTHGKTQQRMVGRRAIKNPHGHFYGTIGSKIDRLIENGAFTKRQIEAYAGTKMSKVNSHIAHLKRDVKRVIVIDQNKRVKFA